MPVFTIPLHEHGDPSRPGPYPHGGKKRGLKGETTPDVPENADHFLVGVEWTPMPTRPWRVVTKSGRVLKTFGTPKEAERFIDRGGAYRAARLWRPGVNR